MNFLTLFHVTLIKYELQKSNLHQMNHLKVYFLTYFMQNSQKLNMVGYTASNMWPKRYGGPCTTVGLSPPSSLSSAGPVY